MAKSLLVDTDVMVDFLKGYPKAVTLVRKYAATIILSSIVTAELYAAVKGNEELRTLDELISVFRIVPVSNEISRLGGLFKRDYAKSFGIGLADAIVAATAEIEHAEPKTLNVRHYPMIRGLESAYKKS